ncbi:hypothetical protein ACHAPO_006190 [Fusarium lateritium]
MDQPDSETNDWPVETDQSPVEEDESHVEEDEWSAEEDESRAEDDESHVDEDEQPAEEDEPPVETDEWPIEAALHRVLPSKKPSAYVFDSHGDTCLILETFTDRTFFFHKDQIWIGSPYSRGSYDDEPQNTTPESESPSDRAKVVPMHADTGDLDSSVIASEYPDYGERPGSEPGLVEIRMRVSGKHLALASPCFKKILDAPVAEEHVDDSGLRRITARGWHPWAFNAIINIIHLHHRDVPKSLSLELLAELAMIVDYYECHECMEPYHIIWLESLQYRIPTEYGQDCILFMGISSVFGHSEYLASIHSAMDELRCRLEREDDCSFVCSSMLLGCVTKELHRLEMKRSPGQLLLHGLSIEHAIDYVKSMWRPGFLGTITGDYYEHGDHTCTIHEKLLPALEKAENELLVLNLRLQSIKNDTGR